MLAGIKYGRALLGAMSVMSLTQAQAIDRDGIMPGQWAQSFTVQLMRADDQIIAPMGEPQTSTETDCITNRDIMDPAGMLMAGAEDDCEISRLTMAKGKIDFAMSCKFSSNIALVGHFQGEYTPTTLTIQGKLRPTDGGAVSGQGSMSAHRIGACSTK